VSIYLYSIKSSWSCTRETVCCEMGGMKLYRVFREEKSVFRAVVLKVIMRKSSNSGYLTRRSSLNLKV